MIVAANGIGTPRLLLLSASERHPDGLANSSGLVGRNLMFHPYSMITGFFDDGIAPTWQGPLGNILISQEFYETDRSRGFVRGYSFQMNRSTGPAKTAAGFTLPPIALGPGPPRRFRPPLRQFRAARGDRRGPARGAQSRRRSIRQLDGLARHRRAQGVLHAVGELGAA